MREVLIQAGEEHLPAMLDIVAEAQAFLRGQGLDQWQNGYPGRDTLLCDIRAGSAWLVPGPNGAVLATATLQFGEEPTYKAIYGGEWASDAPYATVHRMAVRGATRGQGVAARMLAGLEALCLTAGVRHIRADTHPGNRPTQRLLEGAGYAKRGTIYLLCDTTPFLRGGNPSDERLAYEKAL